ncbi:MAG: sporulation protein, partial [Ruminococcus sp.]|nr:sporulation protein [Ruminococcus sp.]
YTDEEAEEKAENKLQVYIDDLRKKGVEILENNVTISIRNGKCHADGHLVTSELVGIPSDISLFEQGEAAEE